jgi:mRNA interferase MazF
VGTPAVGAVVLVRFPFSDLSRAKLRPAIVLAHAGRGDAVLCQVTSKSYGDARAIAIGATDLTTGSLRVASFARPGKLFTAKRWA